MSPLLQHLYELVGERAVLLPIPKGKKGPEGKAASGWSDTTFEQTQDPLYQRRLESKCKLGGNIGIVLGPASSNLCTIDIDTDAEIEAFLKLNPQLASTLRTRGANGCQIWVRIIGEYPVCRINSGLKVPNIKKKDKSVAEWRGGGGHQSVIHGKHPGDEEHPDDEIFYQFVVEAPAIEVAFAEIKWPAHWEMSLNGSEPRVVAAAPRDAIHARTYDDIKADNPTPLEAALEKLLIADVWQLCDVKGEPPNGNKLVRSPFREDKKPSFSIYAGGKKWKDHGTGEQGGEQGDAADFLAKAKNLSKEEGCRELIRLAGTQGGEAASQDFHAVSKSMPESEYQECTKDDGFYDDVLETKAPDFRDTALHGPLGEVSKKLEPECESHIAAIHLPLMCTVGNIFGRTIFRNISGSLHYPALFVANVGTTASNKSSGWDIMQHCVLNQIADKIWLEWCLRRSSLASGEGVIVHLRDKDDQGNPRIDERSLFYERELSRVLKIAYRPSSTVSELLINAWDGAPLGNMALKNRDENRHFVTTTNYLMGINSEVNRDILMTTVQDTSMANGLVNRFLFAAAPETDKCFPMGADFSKIKIDTEIKLLKAAVRFAQTHKGKQIEWSEDAAAEWKEIYEGFKKTAKLKGQFYTIIARGAPYTVRLAMIYAIADQSLTIEASHLRAAHALWKYCEESASWAFSHIRLSSNAEKIYHRLSVTPSGELTLAQISADVFRGHATSVEIRKALQELEEKKFIKRFTKRTPGRDVTIVRLL